MKINILTSNCKKGNCGPECPYCRMNEMFSSLAGDEAFHNEEGILQEAVENIIPPAFNRLADYAKLGEPSISEASLNVHPRSTPEEYKKSMARYVERHAMSSKAAQDVFAQYIVRYYGRSYEHRGRQIDFAFNPMSINRMFSMVTNRFRGNPHYLAWYKSVTGETDSYGHINDDVKGLPQDSQAQGYRGPKVNQEQAKEWYVLKDKIDAFFESFGGATDTSRQWVDKGRQMAANGANSQEMLVFLGRQYLSLIHI